MGIVNTKGNESVLPWYKGEGREKEKVSVHRVISFDILSRNGYNYIFGLMVKFGLTVFYLFGLPVKNLAFQFSIYSAFLSKIWPSG